jgi:hypothetical protein
MLGVGLLAGWLIGVDPDKAAPPASKPAEVKTVTVIETKTVTVTKVPEVCLRAIELMRLIIADTRTLNSKGDVQIDIATAANRAIFEKDWAGLREVQERQRTLMTEQAVAHSGFANRYDETLRMLTACVEAAR